MAAASCRSPSRASPGPSGPRVQDVAFRGRHLRPPVSRDERPRRPRRSRCAASTNTASRCPRTSSSSRACERARSHRARARGAGAQARRPGLLREHRAEPCSKKCRTSSSFPRSWSRRFSSAEFLELPEEVLTTTLIHHQHYFPVVDDDGRAEAGVSRRDQHAAPDERADRQERRARRDGAAARRAVLLGRRPEDAARGSAASASHTMLFHKQLGSYRDKAERIEALARGIARDGSAARRRPTRRPPRAARLAKADLATDMVRRVSPSCRGTMGGIYAREEGTARDGLEGHLLPLSADRRRSRRAAVARRSSGRGGGDVGGRRRSPTSSIRSSALFGAGERPTGSRDPFGLRRRRRASSAILAICRTLTGRRSAGARWLVERASGCRGRHGRRDLQARCRSSCSSGCATCSSSAAFDRAERAGRRRRRPRRLGARSIARPEASRRCRSSPRSAEFTPAGDRVQARAEHRARVCRRRRAAAERRARRSYEEPAEAGAAGGDRASASRSIETAVAEGGLPARLMPRRPSSVRPSTGFRRRLRDGDDPRLRQTARLRC